MANPKFTRRHYEAIADVLAEAQADAEDGLLAIDTEAASWGVAHVAGLLVRVFAEDNPNFDRIKFLTRAGW